MQWVHDRTVDGMNAGTDVHTLMREVRLPEHLDVGEGYGTVAWNVRAIWENYAGWFHHRSTTELYAPRPRGRWPPTWWPRPAPTRWWPPPGPGSTPASPSPRCTSPTSCWPSSPATPGPGPWPPAAHEALLGRQRELLGVGLAAPGDRQAGRRRPWRNELGFDSRGPGSWSPAAPAASATPSPRPSPTPGRGRPSPAPGALGRTTTPTWARFTYRQLQLTDVGERRRPARRASATLDVLVNNAGANLPGGRDEWDPEGFAEAVALNLTGPCA